MSSTCLMARWTPPDGSAAPLTAYLLGLAVGRSSDPEATADRLAQQLCLLAQRWQDGQRESS